MPEINANNTVGFLLQTMLYLSNHTLNVTKDIANTIPIASPIVSDAICYGVYGCFSIGKPWSDVDRPVNWFPESPSKMNVKFPLFNKHNTDTPHFVDINDPESVKSFKIGKWAPLFILSHGFLESGNRPWLRDLTKALLKREKDATVIIVDWVGGSSPPYGRAATNIRLVGAMAAHVIHLIYEECKLPNLNRVHFIGHSLGAHLAGYAGYHLQNDFGLILGRITGLDPAEPLFSNTDPIIRLDRMDARYVDVIHTDASPFVSTGGLGLFEPIGHVDFYPNGGYDQPGCTHKVSQIIEEKGSFFWGLQEFLGCNHIRSYQLFQESVESKSFPLYAIQCDSYEEFIDGTCFSCQEHSCITFGYGSKSSYDSLYSSRRLITSEPIKAYILTRGEPPYIGSHYKITSYVSNSDASLIHGGEIGRLKIVLHDKNHTAQSGIMYFPEEPKLFEPGHMNSSVVLGNNVGLPEYAILDWEYNQNILNPLTWRILATPRIYLDEIKVESLDTGASVRMCPALSDPVESGQENYFIPENCAKESR